MLRCTRMSRTYLLATPPPADGRTLLRHAGIVDVPNAVCTLAIPTAIFDQDVRPKSDGPPTGARLVKRGDVVKSPYTGSMPTFKNLCPGCN